MGRSKVNSVLEKIQSPGDLKKIPADELEFLAEEMRSLIIHTVSENGGHLAPNLGVVELTIALHRVFQTPQDHIVWDVGHQSYAHKLLTGRLKSFSTIRKFDGLSGFTLRGESEHDCFGAGHAGTAISSAMGFSSADDLQKKQTHTVAVTGDGSLICGISLEALNNLSCTCKNMILVLNDNKMSISKSIGAIPNYLNHLITGKSYNRFKAFIKMMVQRMPKGKALIGNIQNLEASAKNLFVPGIFFEELGIRYVGPVNGHDLPGLIQTFERVKEFNRPVIVHVITEKGHGCPYALAEPERFHGVGQFIPETGEKRNVSPGKITFSEQFGKTLDRLMAENDKITAVTAAMASGCGLNDAFTERYHDRFFDVGIAEEHAVVFAGGQAAAGLRPVVAIYTTFFQRAFDCIFHDVCLQNLPVVFCADRAGIVEDGPTHHGIYDLAFLRAMPNLSILAPCDEMELDAMLTDVIQNHPSPVMIRYGKGNSGMAADRKHTPLEWGKCEVVRTGTDAVIWTYGKDVTLAWNVAERLASEYHISCGVVNARYLKPFDAESLRSFAARMPVITLEDHVLTGGLASIASEILASTAHKGLYPFGWDVEKTVLHGSPDALRRAAGLDTEQLSARIHSILTDTVK